MHIVTIPRVAPRRLRPCINLTVRIAPVAPIGWPRAIAPPHGLTCVAQPCVARNRHGLSRERLVEFDHVDGRKLESCPCESERYRARGRVSHLLRLDSDECPRDESQPCAQPPFLGLGSPHQHERRRAVVDSGRIPGGHRPFRPEHRTEAP